MSIEKTLEEFIKLGFDVEILTPSRRERLAFGNGAKTLCMAYKFGERALTETRLYGDDPEKTLKLLLDQVHNKFNNPL